MKLGGSSCFGWQLIALIFFLVRITFFAFVTRLRWERSRKRWTTRFEIEKWPKNQTHARTHAHTHMHTHIHTHTHTCTHTHTHTQTHTHTHTPHTHTHTDSPTPWLKIFFVEISWSSRGRIRSSSFFVLFFFVFVFAWMLSCLSDNTAITSWRAMHLSLHAPREPTQMRCRQPLRIPL